MMPLHRTRLSAICLLAFSLAVSTGCLEDDDLANAVEEVSLSFATLASPGSPVSGQELKSDTYRGAISTLKPLIGGKGTDLQKSSAWLLVARAELGLAEAETSRLSAAQTDARGLIAQVRANLTAYRRISALVAAQESFDAGDEITALQSQISERSAAIDIAKAALDDVTARVAAIDAEVAEALAQADDLVRQESDLRARALPMDPREALPLIEQAAALRTKADGLSVEAERRTAKADTIRPELVEHEAEIDRLTEQLRLFESSIESLQAETQEVRAKAQELRTQSSAIEARIAVGARELTALIVGDLSGAFNATAEAHKGAAGSARKASGHRNASRLMGAEIQHTLGTVAEANAALLETVSTVCRDAMEGVPAVNDPAVAELAREAAARAAEAAAIATEALTAARDDYQGVSVTGEGSELIDGVIARINENLGVPAEPEAPADDAEEFTEDQPAEDSDAPDQPTDE